MEPRWLAPALQIALLGPLFLRETSRKAHEANSLDLSRHRRGIRCAALLLAAAKSPPWRGANSLINALLLTILFLSSVAVPLLAIGLLARALDYLTSRASRTRPSSAVYGGDVAVTSDEDRPTPHPEPGEC